MAKEPVIKHVASSMDPNAEKIVYDVQAKKFVTYTRTKGTARKRNQKPAGGWLRSPGHWEPFAEGHSALCSIAKPDHLVDGEVRRVGVGGFEGERRIYMWTTHESDPDGIEVKSYGRRIRINIAEFLAGLKLRPEVGVMDRYDLIPADAHSPVQPALMIDLDKSLERKYFETSKKKSASKQKAGTQASGSTQPQASGSTQPQAADSTQPQQAGSTQPQGAGPQGAGPAAK